MTEFTQLLTTTFSTVSDFLMSEPIIYFVGLSVILCIGLIIKKLTRG